MKIGWCLALVLVGCTAPKPSHRTARFAEAQPVYTETAVTAPVELAPAASSNPEPVGGPLVGVAKPVARPITPSVPAPAPAWVNLESWAASNKLPAPVLVKTTAAPGYSLSTPSGLLLLRVGSDAASWRGFQVRLGFAPQLIGGRPFVHSIDLRKNIEPLLASTADVPNPPPVLVLDPGHGGEDSGTRSSIDNSPEKQFSLDWARRTQALLAAKGWQVFLTRTNDSDVALSNRVAFADSVNAGLFVSLHFNSASPNREERGIETYCLTPPGLPSSLTRGFLDNTTAVFPNNVFDAENVQLGFSLHSALVQTTGSPDRGLRRARFLGVLRGQQRPAVLLEGGYLSNPAEARLIAEPAHRQKLAEALAAALLNGSRGVTQQMAGARGSSVRAVPVSAAEPPQ